MRHQVLVSPAKLKDGGWSKSRIVWASFRLLSDMEQFVDKLQSDNPSWVIETRSLNDDRTL